MCWHFFTFRPNNLEYPQLAIDCVWLVWPCFEWHIILLVWVHLLYWLNQFQSFLGNFVFWLYKRLILAGYYYFDFDNISLKNFLLFVWREKHLFQKKMKHPTKPDLECQASCQPRVTGENFKILLTIFLCSLVLAAVFTTLVQLYLHKVQYELKLQLTLNQTGENVTKVFIPEDGRLTEIRNRISRQMAEKQQAQLSRNADLAMSKFEERKKFEETWKNGFDDERLGTPWRGGKVQQLICRVICNTKLATE